MNEERSKHAPKRTPEQRERDLAELAKRYLRGEYQADIARLLGVSQQQISYDLGVLRKRWQASALSDFDAKLGQELAKIDQLERTYWEAWERSLQEAKRETQHVGVGEEGRPKPTGATIVKETQGGNPRWLDGVQWCIEKRCALLGLNAPSKVEMTGKDGTPLPAAQVLIYIPDNGREDVTGDAA